jgi:acylphosphatase
MPELSHVEAMVKGEVQGVYFRAFTSRIAKKLGLRGFAHNLPFGAVEVVAEGPKDKLEEFLEQLHQGPPEALVENVDVKWGDFTGQYVTFDIR